MRPKHRLAAASVAAILTAGLCASTAQASAAPTAPASGRNLGRGEFADHTLLVFPGSHQPIYDFVNAARHSIELTMYELDDTTMQADLVAAAQRGVQVRVILDGRVGPGSKYYQPGYDQLKAGGVDVVWSNPAYYYTHQKTLTVDGRESLIMTGNLDSYYYDSDRDYALFDTDPADVRAIEQTFDADFVYKPITPSAGSGDLVWSPTTSQDRILDVINGAHRTLLVEQEEMFDTDVINALIAAAQRGVQVKLAIIDECDLYPYLNQLLAAGVQISLNDTAADPLYTHAKAFVADYGLWDERIEVGSINISDTSLNQNRELGVVLDAFGPRNLQVIGTLEHVISGDFAGGQTYTATTDPSCSED
jgi:phosphatidylserine/phosphatidylglycerophosphate/cardiolipin synthase-like enzyme